VLGSTRRCCIEEAKEDAHGKDFLWKGWSRKISKFLLVIRSRILIRNSIKNERTEYNINIIVIDE